ncbi:aluminum-activated malate transporter 10-like [Durio zibethinus]|uniref:Aluminum-activated malate transporter 10-like n=1 Tax=Durio zibethinus TaxID=66656 RepID=A0A6P5ZNS7_DURZI|nr:aluminum-activated malate transporter 10-like [Durio zibethinus]
MAPGKEAFEQVEWRIRVADGSSEVLVPATGLARKAWLGTKGLISGLALKVWMFLKKAWTLGANDPRKVIHCIKAGLALTIVSLFYFMRPLNDGFGGNAMWAVMTVVVVFEPTVGGTLYKCLNRVCGTFLAGFLAVGVHWVASRSGERFEPLVVGASVFILASAATFSKFIPSAKSLFEYGAQMFVLTFSFVAVSGYREDKLFDLAHQRISTIIIGTSLCILVIMLVCPIWSGQKLHSLIVGNMDKLADSLNGCVTQYFNQIGECTNSNEEADKKLQGYKCVLSSEATEESMAHLARWEPSHGRFNFRHPWKQYLKIGASMRSCAYCIEALNSCINSENKFRAAVGCFIYFKQAAELIKKHLSSSCLKVSSSSSSAIRELAETVKTMKKSSTIDLLVGEMNSAVQELQNDLKSLSYLLNPSSGPENKNLETACMEATTPTVPLMEIIPVVTLASILIEIVVRIEALVDAVEELGKLAEFATRDAGSKQSQMKDEIVTIEEKTEGTMRALQKV